MHMIISKLSADQLCSYIFLGSILLVGSQSEKLFASTNAFKRLNNFTTDMHMSDLHVLGRLVTFGNELSLP